MRAVGRLASIGMVVLGASWACHDDGTGPSPTQLTGSWRATKAEFVSIANPALKVELIQQGGTVRLSLTEGKTYTLTITPAGGADQHLTGSWSSSADVLTLALSPPLVGEIQFDMALSGSTLTLQGGHIPFDVDGDGVFEESIVNLTMTSE